MRAWILHDVGDFRYGDIPAPRLKEGEALIKIRCAGICSSDVPRVFATGAYRYPIILGHEFAGTVAGVYDEDRYSRWIGKRVGVFPLIPCFKCVPCGRGEYETCRDYGYIGSRRDGAFAEYAAVPVWNLVELPDSVSFEDAAMLEPAAVALHAVKQMNFESAGSAAVIGAGTIGRLIAQWLKIHEVGNVKLIGRDDALPHDADACFEAVGSIDALKNCIISTRPGGQIILVGNPAADFKLERDDYWQILRRQLTLKGLWNSRFPGDWLETARAVETRLLQPGKLITHRYTLSELGQAIVMMRDRSEFRLKVVICPEQDR